MNKQGNSESSFQVLGIIGSIIVFVGLFFPFVTTKYLQIEATVIEMVEPCYDIITIVSFGAMMGGVLVSIALYPGASKKIPFFAPIVSIVAYCIFTSNILANTGVKILGIQLKLGYLGLGFYLMLSGLILMVISPLIYRLSSFIGIDKIVIQFRDRDQ